MGKGRFVNQKLGKNISRKVGLLKSELTGFRHAKPPVRTDQRLPKKGNSRETRPLQG